MSHRSSLCCTASHPDIFESFRGLITCGTAEIHSLAVCTSEIGVCFVLKPDHDMTPDSSTARLLAMVFSEFATNFGPAKNPLYTLYERLKAEAVPIIDLVRGNVN